MNKTAISGLTIQVTAFFLSMQLSPAFAQADGSRQVIETKIRSSILGKERELIVNLPRNYEQGRKYPVMYVLDGSSQDGPIADKFDSLLLLGLAPQTIVVGIPNMSAQNRTLQLVPPFMLTDPDKPDSPKGTADTFLSFMESELIPFIERGYGASNVRAFAGNSRGGLLVMYSLIHNPNLFTGRFCFSTPFWRQDNLLVSRVSEFLSSKKEMNGFIFLSAGANETENIKGGLEAMKRTLEQNAPKGVTWYAQYTPGVDHQRNSKVSATEALQKWSEYLAKLK